MWIQRQTRPGCRRRRQRHHDGFSWDVLSSLAFYSRHRHQAGSREVETCSKTGGRAFKLSLWTWHGPPGINSRVGAPAKARPQQASRLLHFGMSPTPIGDTPIRVRVSTPTDISPHFAESGKRPVGRRSVISVAGYPDTRKPALSAFHGHTAVCIVRNKNGGLLGVLGQVLSFAAGEISGPSRP